MKRGDWAARTDQGARPEFDRVIRVYRDPLGESDETFMDIVLYALNGNRIGRSSPPEGGPTDREPAVPCSNWRRIRRPRFPIPIEQSMTGRYLFEDP